MLKNVKSSNDLTSFIDAKNKKYSSAVKKVDSTDKRAPFEANLKVIAKPCGFSPDVDPGNRIKNYILKKMSLIDIIPCGYKIELKKAYENTKEGDVVGGLRPIIVVDDYVIRYRQICRNYNLRPYDGVRIYTTDDTTASDSLSNLYASNVLQNIMDSLSQKGRQLKEILPYFQSEKEITELVSSLSKVLEKGAGSFLRGFAEKAGKKIDVERYAANLGKAMQSVGEVLLKGNRVSLPKIWSGTDYRPGLVANIKLVSPYGHPKAIREFIIEPLCYLIILAAPKTEDGISWGYPFTVGLRGYGMTHLNVGVIDNITLRRGGSDTAYNIYRQPLTIDVSLSFSTLTDGFAVFARKENMKNESTVKDAEKDVARKLWPQGESPLMVTLGNIIDSLRPMGSSYTLEPGDIL